MTRFDLVSVGRVSADRNQAECEAAVDTQDPVLAAERILELGPRLAIVKRGPLGNIRRHR